MEPKKFEQANKTLTKPSNMTDEECGSLPVFTDGKVCISLWKMTWRERFSALFFGKLWLFVHSGYTQPPVAPMVQREIFSEKQS
ncbi:MAG: hypothetical protein EHM33_05970 [Chloroflexi bacterium]|nr:MAG: hypothetical protein EHM33_05970 [Chloroflexota bacterium]